ncbi:GNAT family N-acetyltransferase [Patescibacteria group bacterium]|nr:GNAT family N-acetyltransferase [Patescibacteria group bacterium]
MEPTDRLAITVLYQKVFSEDPWNENWTQAEALTQLTQDNIVWWVLTKDDQIIGFIAGGVTHSAVFQKQFCLHNIQATPRLAYLAELGVSPNYRRQGLARKLTNHFCNWCTSQSTEGFAVRTRPGTGNNPWYDQTLNVLHTYPDGRILYGYPGVPSL